MLTLLGPLEIANYHPVIKLALSKDPTEYISPPAHMRMEISRFRNVVLFGVSDDG
jgi:hypothetical protein